MLGDRSLYFFVQVSMGILSVGGATTLLPCKYSVDP